MKTWITRRERFVPILAVTVVLAGMAAARTLVASDHQDTPEVELSPRYDVNDVYAFPAADPSRIAILDNFCWGNTDRPETLGSLVRAAHARWDIPVDIRLYRPRAPQSQSVEAFWKLAAS